MNRRVLVWCVVGWLCLLSTIQPLAAQRIVKPLPLDHPTIITRYRIEVALDAEAKRLKGKEQLIWFNDSQDEIRELQFHLYLNAFKNVDTTYMTEAKDQGRDFGQGINAFDFEHWGFIDVNSIRIAGGADLTNRMEFIQPDDNNPYDQTVMRVTLPQPIPPQGQITLEIEFTAQLPQVFARTGFRRDFFMVAQWFPKIGVYEEAGERRRAEGGWNCHQFHANSEFYADFGTYDVDVTVPSNYIVGATGGLPRRQQNNGNGTTTYNFYQEDVHDFAWTASPRFIRVERDFVARQQVTDQDLAEMMRVLGLSREQVELNDVKVILLIQPEHEDQVDRHFRAAFAAIKYYGLWYGRYPYKTLTVVDPPRGASGAGGMEYPTLITAGTDWWAPRRVLSPEGVTVHEFGHQYWYGLVANNEFEEAWLDEGFNSYSTSRVLEVAYGPNHFYERFFDIPVPGRRWLEVDLPEFPFSGVEPIPLGTYWQYIPIHEWQRRWSRYIANARPDLLRHSAWEYLTSDSYRTNAYDKPMLLLHTLENYLGRDLMARVMRTYFQRYRYRHPTTQDFIDTVNEITGLDLGWYFNEMFSADGVVDYAVTNITSEPVAKEEGIYEREGQQVTIQQTDDADEDGLYRSIITVRRLGSLVLPVKVEISFANGERVQEHWDGASLWRQFKYTKPSRVVSAEVFSATLDPAGPNRPIFLDVNFTNNSRKLEPDHVPALRWAAKFMVWIQNYLHQLSMLS
ncbi:MAG: M1 family metallopeptidase [Acidobacteria bacterium]|nr:M1 family metallopeptidase [Acidobacteriota bacterium]